MHCAVSRRATACWMLNGWSRRGGEWRTDKRGDMHRGRAMLRMRNRCATRGCRRIRTNARLANSARTPCSAHLSTETIQYSGTHVSRTVQAQAHCSTLQEEEWKHSLRRKHIACSLRAWQLWGGMGITIIARRKTVWIMAIF